MDSASIAPQVLTPRAITPVTRVPGIPHVQPHATPVRAPIAANDVHVGSAVAAGEHIAQGVEEKVLSKDEQKIANMEKRAGKYSFAGFLLGIPFLLEGLSQMATMFHLNTLPGIRNAGKFKTAMSTATIAGPRAMRDTSLKNMLNLRANYLEEMSLIAEKNGQTKWAENATRKAEAAAQKAAARSSWIAEKFTPVRKAGGRLLDSFESTSIGGKVTSLLNSGAERRLAQVTLKHDAAMEKALAAGRGEMPGFMARAKAFITRKSVVAQAGSVPSELSQYASRIEHAKGLTGIARADHLAETARTLHKAVHGNVLQGEAAARGAGMLMQVEKAAGSASAIHSYGQAAGGTLRNVAKAVFTTVGRAPVFGTLVAAGAVAGVSAHIIEGRIAGAKRKKTYESFVAAAGGPNSEYMQNFHAATKSQGAADLTRTAIHIANEGANVAFATMPGGGGAALGAGQMVGMVGEKLLHDNDAFKAYTELKAGGLSDADQIERTRQLVAITPTLKNDPELGGYWNKAAGPTARALVAKYPDVDARVAVMADPAKFDAFLKEMQAEQTKAAANDTVGQANAHIDITPKAQAEAKYHATERPQIAGLGLEGAKAHQGMLAGQQHIAR